MSNPFSVLEELSQPKTQKKPKKTQKKKKNVKKPVVKKEKPQVKPTQGAPIRRKPKVLIPVAESPKKEGDKTSEVDAEKKSAPAEKRNFDGPIGLKNYKRDNNKGYYNRKQGDRAVGNKGPREKGGKRYHQRDRSVNRTGKRGNTYRKGGEGGKHSWTGSRYMKKKPQELNDEEFEKAIEIDQQNDEKKALKSKLKKQKKNEKKKKAEEKKSDDSKVEESKESKDAKPKKNFKKKNFKKGRKDQRKKRQEEVEEQVEEEESDDEGKTTFEEYEKNRKKPIRLNDGNTRKAGEGIKVVDKHAGFTRRLNKGNQDYMKVTKKVQSQSKKVEKTGAKSTKKKKMKQLSTADFFKGPVKSKGSKGKKGNFKGKGPKKSPPNLKDNKNFPSLS